MSTRVLQEMVQEDGANLKMGFCQKPMVPVVWPARRRRVTRRSTPTRITRRSTHHE